MKRPDRKIGRPTSLTPEVGAQLLEALELTGNIRVASALAGIHHDSFYEWLNRAEDRDETDPRFREFSDDVSELRRRRLRNLHVEIDEIRKLEGAKTAGTRLHAIKMAMQYEFPDLFHDRKHLEVSGEGGGPVRLSVADSDVVMAALDRAGKVDKANAASTNGRQ